MDKKYKKIIKDFIEQTNKAEFTSRDISEYIAERYKRVFKKTVVPSIKNIRSRVNVFLKDSDYLNYFDIKKVREKKNGATVKKFYAKKIAPLFNKDGADSLFNDNDNDNNEDSLDSLFDDLDDLDDLDEDSLDSLFDDWEAEDFDVFLKKYKEFVEFKFKNEEFFDLNKLAEDILYFDYGEDKMDKIKDISYKLIFKYILIEYNKTVEEKIKENNV